MNQIVILGCALMIAIGVIFLLTVCAMWLDVDPSTVDDE